jgi:hypothetical protein
VVNEKLSASAPFQVAAVDVVGDLVVEEDAPKQVVLGFESRGMRIHRAKTLGAKSNGNAIPTIGARLNARASNLV